MDASKIVSDEMSLDEKLKAIDEAMKNAQAVFNEQNGRNASAPLDPAALTVCDGCE